MGRRAVILLLLLSLAGACLLLNGSLNLAPDEAYYWYWSRHPDWSYYDHPPMIALVIALGTALGGGGEWGVRLGGLLAVATAILITILMARSLAPQEKDVPWDLMVIFSVVPAFWIGAVLQTPDTPLFLFWAAALYSMSRIARGGAAGWWYAWGCALGLGLLSKYTMILMVPCTALYILSSPDRRFWLVRREPYLSIVLALLIFSPVLAWNCSHHWVSFAFQLGRGFAPQGKPVISKLLDFLGGQAAILTPGLFVAFVIYSAAALRRMDETLRFLLCHSWPVIGFFVLTTIRGETAEANWPAPAYVAGMALASIVYRRHFALRKSHRFFICASVAAALAATAVIQLHGHRPFLPLNPENDPLKQVHSWKSLGQLVAEVADAYPSDKGYFIVADKGTTAAEAVFYSGRRYEGMDFFVPERYLFLHDLETLRGRNAVIVAHTDTSPGLARYGPYFETLRLAGRYRHEYRGKEIPELSAAIIVGEGYRGNWSPAGAIDRP
ncbi:MAG: glycosyltransferase family 39 protein [Deltaproteobacteria bacterium]|nr:glycosyltransferase family 39 protein [Deltaproteobacteria bacterium]